MQARIECIQEAAALLRQHGLEAVSNSRVSEAKVAASLAAWVQDRDVTGTQFSLLALLVQKYEY